MRAEVAYRTGLFVAGDVVADRGDWPLVGRTRELRQLERLVCGPRSGCAVLAGQAGVGKTRLALGSGARPQQAGVSRAAGALAAKAVGWVAKVWATRATEGLPFGALAPLLPSVRHGETGEVDD